MKVGIIGASGYTGIELVRWLSKHEVELKVINSETYAGKKLSSMYPDFLGSDLAFTNFSIPEINGMDLDLVFLCAPNGVAMTIVPKLNPQSKIIDSADYRFSDYGIYEKVYGMKHIDRQKAVYGLPELYREEIKNARLVANPGCYVTASILAALPLNNEKWVSQIVFDCKSGISGAGKKNEDINNFNNLGENIIPYKITKHRHGFEIQQFVKHKISFTPHVIPVIRGILCTAHILGDKEIDAKKIQSLYNNFYKNEPFVKVIDTLPELHGVQNTNRCLIGGFEADDNRLVIISSIDNLAKGASTQAIQNMNLMLGYPETKGLGGN